MGDKSGTGSPTSKIEHRTSESLRKSCTKPSFSHFHIFIRHSIQLVFIFWIREKKGKLEKEKSRRNLFKCLRQPLDLQKQMDDSDQTADISGDHGWGLSDRTIAVGAQGGRDAVAVYEHLTVAVSFVSLPRAEGNLVQTNKAPFLNLNFPIYPYIPSHLIPNHEGYNRTSNSHIAIGFRGQKRKKNILVLSILHFYHFYSKFLFL